MKTTTQEIWARMTRWQKFLFFVSFVVFGWSEEQAIAALEETT